MDDIHRFCSFELALNLGFGVWGSGYFEFLDLNE